MITRRTFLKVGAFTPFLIGTPNMLTGCERDRTPLTPATINAKVAAVRGENLEAMTR